MTPAQKIRIQEAGASIPAQKIGVKAAGASIPAQKIGVKAAGASIPAQKIGVKAAGASTPGRIIDIKDAAIRGHIARNLTGPFSLHTLSAPHTMLYAVFPFSQRHFAMNRGFFLHTLVFMCILMQGCDIGFCGFYATTTYDSELIVQENFTSIRVAKGDSVEFRPEDNIEIQYYYTGSNHCDGADYTDDPRLFAAIANDSLATVTKFRVNRPAGNAEQRFWIKGQEAGATRILLEAEWEEEGTTDSIPRDQSFEIELTVF